MLLYIVFLELRYWETVRLWEQIILADKYFSIFLRQTEGIFNEKFKILEYPLEIEVAKLRESFAFCFCDCPLFIDATSAHPNRIEDLLFVTLFSVFGAVSAYSMLIPLPVCERRYGDQRNYAHAQRHDVR